MVREVKSRKESWPLKAPFRIARGAKNFADVVIVEIEEDGLTAYGECVPYSRYGESPGTVIDEITKASRDIRSGICRAELQDLMPAGAARNALDCALWDLEAKQAGKSLAQIAGVAPFAATPTARTISIDTVENMARAATAIGGGLIKLKLDGTDVERSVAAVGAAAPSATIIVDANEAWSLDQMVSCMPAMIDARVALIEQPLAKGRDADLRHFDSPIPLCADESCHTTDDLDRLVGLYNAVNIKLDKTGGLTEALRLRKAAEEKNLLVMVGCMVCTSLAIAPAFALVDGVKFIDLDGPLWLQQDRPGGCVLNEGGELMPPPDLHIGEVLPARGI